MLVHSLASKYARFVVIVRQIYWTPPLQNIGPPLLKSDDLFFREPRDIGPPLSKILDTPLFCVCVCFWTITQKEIDLGTRNWNTL